MKLNSFRLINLFTLILFSEMFLISSCGGGGDSFQDSNSQPLTIIIDFPDEEPAPVESRLSENTRTLDDLDTCKIIVSGGIPPIKEIIKEFDIDETKSISVPIGENRMFTFIGQDQAGQPLCRGEAITDVNPESTVVIIGCEFVDETCTDGIDNDSDTLIDCADPDCDRSSCNPDDIDYECIDGECVIPEPSPTPSPGSGPTPGPTLNPGFPGPTPTPTGSDNPTPTPTASSSPSPTPSPTPTNSGDCTGGGGGNCGVGSGGGGGNGTDNEGNNNN